ncbi:MAG TPA: hypothetical protein VHE81_06385 [Lacipirellulaceae bacterium]|nr:hypothetical protein [Lacipirellulaceae bacterium]
MIAARLDKRDEPVRDPLDALLSGGWRCPRLQQRLDVELDAKRCLNYALKVTTIEDYKKLLKQLAKERKERTEQKQKAKAAGA